MRNLKWKILFHFLREDLRGVKSTGTVALVWAASAICSSQTIIWRLWCFEGMMGVQAWIIWDRSDLVRDTERLGDKIKRRKKTPQPHSSSLVLIYILYITLTKPEKSESGYFVRAQTLKLRYALFSECKRETWFRRLYNLLHRWWIDFTRRWSIHQGQNLSIVGGVLRQKKVHLPDTDTFNW